MGKGDVVIYKCSRTATGRIKRISEDKSWAEVEWDLGDGCKHTSRVNTKNIIQKSA